MADNKVVYAKTTEKTLRLDDKLLKKISDKAYSLRLGSDQALMRIILDEYFAKEEENKIAEKYTPSVTLTYSSQDYLKKVLQAARKKDKYLDEDNLDECFKLIVEDGLMLEDINKKNASLQQKIYDLESKLKLETLDKQYWKDRVLGTDKESSGSSKKTKK